ncbi:MAG: hypothetical protein GXY18_07100, partial [Methanomicrobiales archaeon]|nr:hypothetical protein [Methanomicrobiales archaeon]
RLHTPQALHERYSSDFGVVSLKILSTPNTHQRLRSYQIQTNDAVENAIAY